MVFLFKRVLFFVEPYTERFKGQLYRAGDNQGYVLTTGLRMQSKIVVRSGTDYLHFRQVEETGYKALVKLPKEIKVGPTPSETIVSMFAKNMFDDLSNKLWG